MARILIVDDIEANRKALQVTLKYEKHDVDLAQVELKR